MQTYLAQIIDGQEKSRGLTRLGPTPVHLWKDKEKRENQVSQFREPTKHRELL